MNIRDIAKAANVSTSTVSKVMNGKDSDISEETRRRVLQIIEENQYFPYRKYLEKAGIKSRMLGMILSRQNPILESLLKYTEEAARARGYGLAVAFYQKQNELSECISFMKQKNVSGLLLDTGERRDLEKFEECSVYIGSAAPSGKERYPAFLCQKMDGGKIAANRLLREGHRRIACIAGNKDRAAIEGYRRSMAEAYPSLKSFWIREVDERDATEQYGIESFLEAGVTAIVCSSWEITVRVWKRLIKMRVSVPDELSLISVGDNPVLSILDKGITAVRFPAKEICSGAVSFLVDQIENGAKDSQTREYPPALAERGSVAEPPLGESGRHIVVVGSMNMDIMIEAPRIPMAGETQLAGHVYTFPGGKGGNQAAGIGKLGGQAYMIGRPGNDSDGKQLYASLVESHVYMEGVVFDKTMPSGKAYVNIGEDGESTVVVYKGANANLDISQLRRFEYLFENAKFCLISMEIEDPAIEYTLRLCKKHQVEIILKPSDAERVTLECIRNADYLIPNERELNALVPGPEPIEEKVQTLRKKGAKTVIVTLGARGCYLQNEEESLFFEGSDFEAVDTTGGADSFISALAVYLSEGKGLISSIRLAVYASGFTVTRRGVQPALPNRRTLRAFEDEVILKYQL